MWKLIDILTALQIYYYKLIGFWIWQLLRIRNNLAWVSALPSRKQWPRCTNSWSRLKWLNCNSWAALFTIGLWAECRRALWLPRTSNLSWMLITRAVAFYSRVSRNGALTAPWTWLNCNSQKIESLVFLGSTPRKPALFSTSRLCTTITMQIYSTHDLTTGSKRKLSNRRLSSAQVKKFMTSPFVTFKTNLFLLQEAKTKRVCNCTAMQWG